MAASPSIVPQAEHPWLSAEHAPFAGKYAVERILGQGGMGTVFEARHLRVGQRVAIKVLGSTLRGHPELVQRFEREARACGSLSSVHAVRIFDIDACEDGTPFIVMEFLAGRDLSQIVEHDGPQPVSRSVRWVIEACDAIAEAHRLGIIHRDLKPSNLFLAEVEGRTLVKVLDFGIAKSVTSTEAAITQAFCPLGTPQYMSPEQIRCSKDVDVRTDVWSLGVTLYELVTGQTPFSNESASASIAAIAADPVPDPRTLRPELGGAFVEALMRALAKNAKDRYQSVEELVSALAPFATADEDQHSVSAVRRAISSVPELPHTSPSPAASYDVRTFEPREPLPDGTSFPMVSLVKMPIKRRLRSTIAMASAAALGIAALVMTARLGATSTDGTTRAPMSAAAAPAALDVPVVVAAPSSAAPIAADDALLPEIAPAPAARARVGEVHAKPLPAPPVVAALVSATAAARPSIAVGARAADKPSSLATAALSVHGGLSSPGF